MAHRRLTPVRSLVSLLALPLPLMALLGFVPACSSSAEDDSSSLGQSSDGIQGAACGQPGMAPCGPGEVCNLVEVSGGALDHGYCITRPWSCMDNYEPVCATNGITYRNDCARLQAGVPFRGRGPCGIGPNQCPGGCGTGAVCNRSADPTGWAYCHPRPSVCGENFEPVCGGDGRTYRNDCVRLQADVSFGSPGICPGDPSPCPGGCSTGFVCNRTTTPNTPGQCIPRPPTCGNNFDPVCGGNGRTYRNDCLRLQADAAFAGPGVCPGNRAPCPGGCPTGQVCNRTADANAPGSCVERPMSCDNRDEPVCGGNGVTYRNDCHRLQVGASFLHGGPCETACPATYAPVCGAGGMTYLNDCARRQAGVQKVSDGPCP
jgi:hypothetical protein